MKRTQVVSITKLETVNERTDVLQVTFLEEQAYMIFSEAAAQKYIGQTVDVDFRTDLYKGSAALFVATLAEVTVVSTVARSEAVKLYADFEDKVSNIAFGDIVAGHTYNKCVFYCLTHKYDSSIKADWITLKISDKYRRVTYLRLFTPTVQETNFSGQYIQCDVRKTKFGLTTEEIFTLSGEQHVPNPEVVLAKDFIIKTFAEDIEFSNFLDTTNCLLFLEEHIGFEKGSLLLRAATEIALANELGNVTPGVDVLLIQKALILDKTWALNINSIYPKNIRIIIHFSKHQAKLPVALVDVLCEDPVNSRIERPLYLKVKELAQTVLRTRKGDIDPDE